MRWNDKLFKNINEKIKDKDYKICFSFITTDNKQINKYTQSKDFLPTLWSIYNEYSDSIIRIIIVELAHNTKLYDFQSKKLSRSIPLTRSNNISILLWKSFDLQTKNVYNF